MRHLIAIALCLLATAPAWAQRRPTTRPGAKNVSISKYIKSTPEQDAAAMTQARDVAREVEKSLSVKFQEIETRHFLIFTDWPKADAFLKTNLEGAYTVVSKQFDIPVTENVFVGKLPVFMFNRFEDFKKYAQEYDELGLDKEVLGYFAGHDNGGGHLAMWKPQVSSNAGTNNDNQYHHDPVNQWAYTLTHEFTHAFVARYRSNRMIPTWLNEGIAEVIASSQFPRPAAIEHAKEFAAKNEPIDEVFEEDGFKGAGAYPVMRTLVETMIHKDRKAFLNMFDAIKDGTRPQIALKKFYGWDYAGLEKAWRREMLNR